MEMSAGLERKMEKIRRLLDNLVIELSRGTPMIVEGKKDVEALRKLEVTGDIIPAKASGRTFLDVLSEIEKRGKNEVILMMDFDKRGREWTKRLVQNFEIMKIKPNVVFWKELSSLVERDVKDIESLSTYLQSLSRKLGKNILSENNKV